MAEKIDKILRLANERFRQAYDDDEPERMLADEDVRFGINDEGCQWDGRVRSMREGQDPPRPCISINLIPEKIDQSEGEFRQSEISFKVRPVDSQGDVRLANIMAGMLRAIEYDSKARNIYESSYTSTLYSGRGGWRWNVVEDEDNPWVRSLKMARIANIFTLYWDPFSKELDKSDSRFWFCTELVPNEEFKDKYGEDNFDSFPEGEEWENWKTEDARRIAEYWWKEDETVTFYRWKEGDQYRISETPPDFPEYLEEYQEKTSKRPKIKWCKMTAGAILEGPHDDWPSRYFPFVLEIGKEVVVRGQSKTRGKVRFAKEPQMLYNYASSQIIETFSLAPRAPYLADADQIAPYKEIWDSANVKNYFFLPYKASIANPGAKPERQPPITVDAASFNILAILEHNLMGAMGRYATSLGDKGDEKSGKAIMARKSQGISGDATFISNFQAALLHSCRIGIDLIPHVYDTERIVRIIGEDEREYEVPINAGQGGGMAQQIMGANQDYIAQVGDLVNDISMGRYDVRVTVGPNYNTQREEALAMLIELAGRAPAFIQAMILSIVENMDLPKQDQLLKRLKAVLPKEVGGDMEPQPPPPDPKVQIEMEKLALQFRDMLRKEFDSHFKAIGVVAQAESLEAGQQFQQYQSEVDNYHKQIELQQQQQQLEQQAQQAQTETPA